MQVVSQKICAQTSTMPVVNGKVGATRPIFQLNVCSSFRGQQICYNWYSVFVIVPYQTLVCISGVSPDYPSSFVRCFSRIIIWNNYFVSWLNTKSIIFCCLIIYSFHSFILNCLRSRSYHFLFPRLILLLCNHDIWLTTRSKTHLERLLISHFNSRRSCFKFCFLWIFNFWFW
jgi:hypothetical protein